ncbi:hypothetical protein D0862_07698 [Hortaea werneckii]|uniref:DUF1479 domain protein n=1 Tax=Hortaea werneckii TaxID=91943 RepID=A0A3M7GAV0_HORWE|nr:hypothetical protein D0862_07698 [Hortaea werneckii]
MPGAIPKWPAWPEFPSEGGNAKDTDYATAKHAVLEACDANTLRRNWIAVCDELKEITDEIAARRSEMIPVCEASEVLRRGFTDEQVAAIKQTGCAVITDVIPEDKSQRLYDELQRYLKDNKGEIASWPKESPSMYELYESPAQVAIRSDPNHIEIQRRLISLWSDSTADESSASGRLEPLAYLDGLRDRPPRQDFLGLGPHIDAGSLSRWADPVYRDAYAAIFSRDYSAYDAWDLGVRKSAKQDLFPAAAHSGVFRSFQGWTALTPAAPREGSLLLYPNVKAVVAYLLLRPFFKPPKMKGDGTLDLGPGKWELDDSDYFPGTMKTESQRLSRTSHPHLRLEECLVHIPPIKAGDTVWWHSDLCHAVDPEHLGSQNASVVYIPACPSTPANSAYVRQQLDNILAGRPPPDFLGRLDETTLKGYKSHKDLGLCSEARKAYGYDLALRCP